MASPGLQVLAGWKHSVCCAATRTASVFRLLSFVLVRSAAALGSKQARCRFVFLALRPGRVQITITEDTKSNSEAAARTLICRTGAACARESAVDRRA